MLSPTSIVRNVDRAVSANRASDDERKTLILIALSAIVLTVITSCVSVSLAKTFLRHYSYFFDAAYYSYCNALLYAKTQVFGAFPTAWHELLANGRFPIRTVPLVLFAPSLLTHPMAHMATAIPALATFLMVLGITVRRRSGSTLYAIAAMTLFCSLYGLYDPNNGFATYWLDLVAALWAGTAALCLLNSNETRSTKWIIAFGIFASFASLSRYIAAGYVLFSCLPVLAIYTFQRVKQGDKLKGILTPYLLLFLTIGLLAGPFLVSHSRENLEFYSKCCYSLGQALQLSFAEETWATRCFFTDQLLCVLSVLLVLQLFVARKNLRNWHETIIPLWLGISTHVLMVLVLRANGGGAQTHYCVPLLLFAFVSPLAIRANAQLPYARLFSLTTITLAICSFVYSYQSYSYRALNPDPMSQDRKELDVRVAELVVSQNSSLVWNEYFDERAWLPTLEAFYRNHKLCFPAGQTYFTIHESGWTSQYPGLSPIQIADKVKNASNKMVGFSVVFEEPEMAWKGNFNNVYSKTVAFEVAREMKQNSQWRKVATLESKVYGRLAAYANTKADPKAFTCFLGGGIDIHPGHLKSLNAEE